MVKIGYLSYDASIKIHHSGRFTSTKTGKTGYGGIIGYIRHIDRGTDKRNGCEVQHSNPDINPDCTLENESYYKDNNGNWKPTNQSADMVEAVNRRIEYARNHGARISTKGQNDTVIVRPLVLQLDRDVIAEHSDTWVRDCVEILEDMFGEKNITGLSVHKDETNVHMHVVFIPCYETKTDNGDIKCTLSQTRFFRNPKQLAAMHRKIRKHLCDKGYDVEQENKPIEEHLAGYYDRQGEWHQQGLTPEQLKQLTDREVSIKVKEIEMSLKRYEIDSLEKAMQDMQKSARLKQEELEREREALSVQQATLANEKANVQTQILALSNEKENLEKMKSEAEEMLQKVYTTADVCNKILAEEKKINEGFLNFLSRESVETKKPYRQVVERLYKKYLTERRNNMAPWAAELEDYRNSYKRYGYVPDISDGVSSAGFSGYDFFV